MHSQKESDDRLATNVAVTGCHLLRHIAIIIWIIHELVTIQQTALASCVQRDSVGLKALESSRSSRKQETFIDGAESDFYNVVCSIMERRL